ncbi:MAG: hypothetical protein GX292_03545 [Bacteroidales bacterium]|jgi:hypothetical protein|nr:hypothetical protein [Bacteroidales bacterium]
MNKFLKFFSNKLIQRISYFILLLVYNFLIFFNRGGIMGESSINIPFIWFWMIPTIVLSYQIIFNNKIGWWALALLFFLYLVWTILSITELIILESNNQFYYILESIPLWIILFSFGCFLYLISPYNRQNNRKLPD